MAGVLASNSNRGEKDVVGIFPGTGFLINDFLREKLDGGNLPSMGTGRHGQEWVLDFHRDIVTDEKKKEKFGQEKENPLGEWNVKSDNAPLGALFLVDKEKAPEKIGSFF